MEPAVERREHLAALHERCRLCEPQWSPPLKGGSTRDGHRDGYQQGFAAMEPAVERREHQPATFGLFFGPPAAMEPAVERREHPPAAVAGGHRAPGRNGAR